VGGAIDDKVFNAMLSKALLSNESLCTMLNQLLKTSQVPNRIWIASILFECLTRLFHELWEPVTSWVRNSEDIISGASGQFYSLEDIDTHLQLYKAKGSKLALVDLSEWNAKLHAKLHRAKLFEMEVWSAIRACTQPVVTVLNTTRPAMGDDEGWSSHAPENSIVEDTRSPSANTRRFQSRCNAGFSIVHERYRRLQSFVRPHVRSIRLGVELDFANHGCRRS
jgi:hypothetical protein